MMSNEAFRALSRALHEAEPPAELAQLSEDQLRELATAIEEVHQHQEESLQQAMEEALSHIPGMLRKSVRRMLFS
jgi:DNA polymerase III delta subunit